jgi:hypothetical protein
VPNLDHTAHVQRLIDEGRLKEAAALHNAHLEKEFEKAKRGTVINLSDLMAAKEVLDMQTPASPPDQTTTYRPD